jgi:anaerobic magnesium-protoporphyrin IX monomethyl ester cyclase
MMFWGTYTSDFYRAVRDLLHSQVQLAQEPRDGHMLARRQLQQRWHELLQREPAYRNTLAQAPGLDCAAT